MAGEHMLTRRVSTPPLMCVKDLRPGAPEGHTLISERGVAAMVGAWPGHAREGMLVVQSQIGSSVHYGLEAMEARALARMLNQLADRLEEPAAEPEVAAKRQEATGG